MAATQEFLSGSTNGKQIKVAAGSTPGTTIHTAVSGTAQKDNVWLWADNDSTSDVTLTIEWGGTTDVDNTIKVTIPGKGSAAKQDGLFCVVPGLPINNGNVIKAYASSANVIKLSGFALRS